MAKYKVTGPDGASYMITAPEGASETEVMDYASKNFGASFAAPEKPKVGALEAAWRGPVQGVSSNWSDEATGFVKNLPAMAKAYGSLAVDAVTPGAPTWERFDKHGAEYMRGFNETVGQERERNKLAREQHPLLYTGGEIVGGMAPLVGSYALTAGTGGAAAPAASATTAAQAGRVAAMGSRMWQGAKAAAPVGAIAGAGAAESAPDADLVQQAANTVGGAAKGATIAAGIGAAVPPVAAAGRWAWGKGADTVRPLINPASDATTRMVREIEGAAGGAPNAVQNFATQAQNMARAAPGTTLADAGEGVLHPLMQNALRAPSAEASATRALFADRAANQHQVISDRMITPHLGDPNTYTATLNTLMKNRAAAADKNFSEAYAGSFQQSQKLTDLMRSTPELFGPNAPIAQSAINAANTKASLTGQPVSQLELMHLVKAQLDKAIKWGENPMSQLGNSSAANIDQGMLKLARGKFVDALRESKGDGVEKYFKAVQHYGEEGGIARAMEAGAKLRKGTNPDEIAALMAKMTPQERDALRHGYAAARADVNAAGNASKDRIARDWNSPKADRQLQTVLADKPQALREMAQTRGALTAQNATAQTVKQAAEQAKAESALAMAQRAMEFIGKLGKGDVLGAALKATGNDTGMLPGVRSQVLQQLRGPVDDMVPALVRKATKQKQDQARHEAIIRMVTRGGAVAAR